MDKVFERQNWMESLETLRIRKTWKIDVADLYGTGRLRHAAISSLPSLHVLSLQNKME